MMEAVDTNKKLAGPWEFQREFSACWRAMPDKGLFAGLLAAWLALFHFLGNSTFGYTDTPSIFGWMKFVYATSPGDSHGAFVPLVVVALFWWKRKALLAVPKANWWPGLWLVALALVINVLGYMVQQPRVSIMAFFVGLYGLTGLVWGRGWLKASFFPFFLFAFCMPLATVSEPITFPLRLLVTQISVSLAHLLGIDVIRDGSQIFDSQHAFAYDVAPACSGIRSLIALLALTTIYGFVVFRSPWKRLSMIVLAVPLAVLGNVMRITAVIVAAEAAGQEAGAWVEQKLGFVTFAVALGCVWLLERWWHEPEATTEEGNPGA
jgi:exosortase